MTPEQALTILNEAAGMALLTREKHLIVQTAADRLREYFAGRPTEAPAKED